MVDCADEPNKLLHCNGGTTDKAYEYIFNNSLMMQEDYPYRDVYNKTCSFQNSKGVAKITKDSAGKYISRCVKKTNGCDTFLLKEIISRGPYTTSLKVTNKLKQYKGGIFEYTPSDACTDLTYAVIVVGIDFDTNIYTIKNSWGTTWGENGFMRIKLSKTTKIGEWYGCGINSITLQPIKVELS